MQTIRGRLTAWYSAALVLTLTAFAIVLYVARRRASYDELDQRIRSEAELTTAILSESYRARGVLVTDRKSTRLNSSHSQISYAVFCLKKKNATATAPKTSTITD